MKKRKVQELDKKLASVVQKLLNTYEVRLQWEQDSLTLLAVSVLRSSDPDFKKLRQLLERQFVSRGQKRKYLSSQKILASASITLPLGLALRDAKMKKSRKHTKR